MTLQQLKYVVTTAESQNITEASKKIFISQPSLTAAIHAIEQEMGITIFSRTNKGVIVTNEGEEFLSYARQVLLQASLLEEKYKGIKTFNPRFSVSCQHYSFAVNAFVDVIQEFGGNEYDFILRETQTHEIIEDVRSLKSEIGILYKSRQNEDVIGSLIKKNGLTFHELLTTNLHVFISARNPLSQKDIITKADLEPYPYLTYEQGDFNAFYFTEEPLPLIEHKKNIKVRDRATLFNMLIGLNGFTICSGIISVELNGKDIIARPLDSDERMTVGYIKKKEIELSPYGKSYISSIKKYISSPDFKPLA